ncbi:MAG: flagellar basal body P-ring formation chaperone FlgA [Oligoflexus sp.]
MMIKIILSALAQVSIMHQAYAIDHHYGFQTAPMQQDLDIAPQVQLDVSLHVKADEILLKSERIFVSDVFHCHAPANVCHEVAAIDLGSAPKPGQSKLASLEDMRNRIVADVGGRYNLEIEGNESLRLVTAGVEIEKSMIEEELALAMESLLSSDKRIQIKSLFFPPGLKVHPGDLTWRFINLSSMAESIQQSMWSYNQPTREISVDVQSRSQGIVSHSHFKLRFRLEILTQVPVAKTTIPLGEMVKPEKFDYEWLAVKSEPVLNIEQVAGMKLTRRLQRGQYLRKNDVQEPFLVERGQLVDVILMSGSLQLRGQAKALASGSLGQSVPVQLISNRKRLNGQVISASTIKVTE